MTDGDSQSNIKQQLENLPVDQSLPKPDPLPVATESVSLQRNGLKKSNKKLWAIIVIALGIFAICCLAGFIAFIYFSVIVAREKRPIEQVLDSFMYAQSVKSAESAYALLSPRAKQQNSIHQIQKLLEGNHFG